MVLNKSYNACTLHVKYHTEVLTFIARGDECVNKTNKWESLKTYHNTVGKYHYVELLHQGLMSHFTMGGGFAQEQFLKGTRKVLISK